ncbi:MULTISPECIES: IS110 family transposase [unclassified Microcoleus]|uniref:IS110 family transposase n=1 Tax=unclassified Microcoleus TaxID=2642155 RepID=UPI002FD031CC
MNQQIIKQVAGIDVAQDELVVSLGYLTQDLCTKCIARKTFANNVKGFSGFRQWLEKSSIADVPLQIVMEATGVYHESVAYFLADHGYAVSIVLPNKISNYARTLDIKTVTDKTSAEAIMLFGLQRKLMLWKRPLAVYKRLRQLTRERDQVIGLRTMAKNHLHAEQAEAEPNKESVVRINKQIRFFTQQIEEIAASINSLVQMDAELKRRIKQSCTIPGVGVLTAATVLAETNGFDLIKNKKQLSSYAGLDVREKQSGTSVNGKPRISKRGNRYLRKCLHMPALSAIRSDQRLKAVFARLVSRHGIKMKAAVAIQRKLLEMIYTLYKKDKNYDKEYYKVLESDI